MLEYTRDIKPLFRRSDVAAMKPHGMDLSSYEDVSVRADDILTRLEDGSMPCDGQWPQTVIDKFKQWIADGKMP